MLAAYPFHFLSWIYILSNHYNIAVTTPNFPALQKYTYAKFGGDSIKDTVRSKNLMLGGKMT